MEYGIAKISTKGQIVIPNVIREKMNLKENEQLLVMSDNDQIYIRPVNTIVDIKQKKSKDVEDFIRGIRHDKILADMEKGKEISVKDAL
jgi:AbrB family looped-hinge helix DNA binding protein